MHDEFDLSYIQVFAVTADISDYIAALPEPQRSICRALVIEGESSECVAGRFHVSTKTILRRSRKALAPLAVAYGITNAAKYVHSGSTHDIRTGTKRIGSLM